MEEELQSALQAVRERHFDRDGASCDYAALGASGEQRRLAQCLAALEAFDLKRVRIAAQTAFWLNVFNALVLRDARELAHGRDVREGEAFFERARARRSPSRSSGSTRRPSTWSIGAAAR